MVTERQIEAALRELLETIKLHKANILTGMTKREIGFLMDAMHMGNTAILNAERDAALLASQSTPPPEVGELLDRFERAAMAYERLGKITRDDEKSRAMRKDVIRELADVRREAAAALSVGWRSIPEGWRLVPIEPTDLMGLALPDGYKPGSHSATQIWRAMIAAAPLPAQGEQG